MKVIIEKTAKVVIEVPDDYVNEYFGENISETNFVYWADRDVNVDSIHEMEEVDNKIETWNIEDLEIDYSKAIRE